MTAVIDAPAPAATVLREVQSRKIQECWRVRLLEGDDAIDVAGRTARVVIITQGLGNLRDRNYYEESAVTSAALAFEGKQFYVDHPSRTEEEDRPERSVRDLAGYFYGCQAMRLPDPETGESLAACLGTLRFAESEPGRLAFEQVQTALEYQRRFPQGKNVYAGISINAGGVSRPGMLRGMQVNLVSEIVEAFSADIVTKPARGGKFLGTAILESVVGSQVAVEARLAGWRAQQSSDTEGRMTTTRVLTEAEQTQLAALGEKISKAVAARENFALALLDDIQVDFAALKQQIAGGAPAGGAPPVGGGSPGGPGGGPAGAPVDAPPPGGDAKPPGDIKPPGDGQSPMKKPGEAGTMPPGAPMGGMPTGERGTNTPGAGMPGGGGTPMKYNCGGCGQENQVVPPTGYQLTRMGESAKPADAPAGDKPADKPAAAREAVVAVLPAGDDPVREALVVRLTRQLREREGDKLTGATESERTLRLENITLRARLHADTILREAADVVTESKLPPDVLTATDLVAFTREQWPTVVKGARAGYAREAEDRNFGGGQGGVGRTGAGSPREAAGGEGVAVATFKSEYARDGE